MRNKGFTLIELLVVISIIALLSSVVLSSLSSARNKARYTQAIAQMRQIQIAATGYYSTLGTYPGDTGPGAMPSNFSSYLSSWPQPTCANHVYDWNNTSNSNTNVNVDLRTITPNASLYNYCIYSSTGSCGGVDILTLPSKQIPC